LIFLVRAIASLFYSATTARIFAEGVGVDEYPKRLMERASSGVTHEAERSVRNPVQSGTVAHPKRETVSRHICRVDELSVSVQVNEPQRV
jgi:hypothetical protein